MIEEVKKMDTKISNLEESLRNRLKKAVNEKEYNKNRLDNPNFGFNEQLKQQQIQRGKQHLELRQSTYDELKRGVSVVWLSVTFIIILNSIIYTPEAAKTIYPLQLIFLLFGLGLIPLCIFVYRTKGKASGQQSELKQLGFVLFKSFSIQVFTLLNFTLLLLILLITYGSNRLGDPLSIPHGFHINTMTLQIYIGATIIKVLGLVYIVVKDLFPLTPENATL